MYVFYYTYIFVYIYVYIVAVALPDVGYVVLRMEALSCPVSDPLHSTPACMCDSLPCQ